MQNQRQIFKSKERDQNDGVAHISHCCCDLEQNCKLTTRTPYIDTQALSFTTPEGTLQVRCYQPVATTNLMQAAWQSCADRPVDGACLTEGLLHAHTAQLPLRCCLQSLQLPARLQAAKAAQTHSCQQCLLPQYCRLGSWLPAHQDNVWYHVSGQLVTC